jgi:hypothetical protein
VKKAPVYSFDISREGIEARLDEMGQKLERLRGLYESFFMGIERSPPDVLRREMNRQILEMQQVPVSNASLRFRYQALTQRWVLLITYWNRTLREIEAGTFSRDLSKAKRRMAEKGNTAITLAEALAMGIPASRAKAFVARQQMVLDKKTASQAKTAAAQAPEPVPQPASPPPRPAVGPPPIPLPGMSEADLQDTYRRYVEAHKQAGGGAAPPPIDKLRQRLAKQLPQILEANRCSRVRMEIAVDGDKVRLRAWPVSDKG